MAQKQSSHDWEKTFVLMLAVVGGMAVLRQHNGIGTTENFWRFLVADESGMWVLSKRLDRGTFAWPAANGMMAYVRKSPNARAAKYLSYAGVVIIWAVVGMMIMLVLAG